jgi:hypothetical protein
MEGVLAMAEVVVVVDDEVENVRELEQDQKCELADAGLQRLSSLKEQNSTQMGMQ